MIGYVHLIIYFIIKRQLTLRNSWVKKSKTNESFDSSVKIQRRFTRSLTSYLLECIHYIITFIKSALNHLGTSRLTESWNNNKKILEIIIAPNEAKINTTIKAITCESPKESEHNMRAILKKVHLQSEKKTEQTFIIKQSNSDIFQSFNEEHSRDSLSKMEDKYDRFIIHEFHSQNSGEQTYITTSEPQEENSRILNSLKMDCKFKDLSRLDFHGNSSNDFHTIVEKTGHSSAAATATAGVTSRSISSTPESCRIKSLLRREKRTEKTVAIVLGCFVGCWLPLLPQYLGEIICSCMFPEYLIMAVSYSVYFNSCCNPFIYAFYNKSYADAFKKILHIEGYFKRKNSADS
ncbi:unnamed protein product [Trichobilharzia szidati]|nr:unnamed protein product [Trichobilharzia szidati]